LLAFLAPALFGQVTIQNGTYSSINSSARQYRVYYPSSAGMSAKLPVVVFIHGGGWYEGGLSDGPITPSACNSNATIACALAENGYVVYSIDYTLVSTFGGADLAITGSNIVSSNSTPFTAADVGSALLVLQTNGAGWNIGGYTVQSVSNGQATLSGSPGTIGLTKGRFSKINAATLWPAQWQDCNCFLQYMAGALGVSVPGDPQNIFLFGHSAGAQLAGVLGLAGNHAFPTNCDHSPANYTIRGIIAASPPTDLVSLYTETATAQSDIRNLLGCIPGYGDCNQIALTASITNYVGENLPPYFSLSGVDDTTIPPANAEEASTNFANLNPPVNSQWVELSPNFYHDLDLYYYTPCSSDPTIGAEPAPCGSAGTAFTKISAFISSLQLYAGELTITAGNNQTIMEGAAAATALAVEVADQYGRLLPNASVTFTSTAGASFNGAGSVTVVSDSNGIATAPALTASSSPGPLNVTASSAGVSATFSLTVAQQTAPASLTVVSGNNQSVVEGGTANTPLAVSVTNQYGQTIAGAAVTFTSGAGATFSGASSAAVVSNLSGIATAPALTANSTVGSLSVTATSGSVSATFSLTVTQQSAPASVTIVSGNSQSIKEGTAASVPLAVSVTNQYSQTLPGVTVTFTSGAGASFSGATSAVSVTNSSGVATAPGLIANSTVGPLSVTASANGVSAAFSLTITQQTTPTSLAIVSGNNQSIVEGGTAATPLAVSVTNQYGQTIPGLTVTFSSAAGGSFGGAPTAAVVTNSSGIATAPALTANSTIGPLSVTASANGASAAFSLTITQQTTPTSLAIVSGNNQSIVEGGTASTPLAVSVTNQYSQTIPGLTVVFASGAGGSFGGAASAAVVSNSSGIATAPALTVNPSPGPLSVTASSGSVSITFSLTIAPLTAPASLTIASGNYQSIPEGGTASTTLAVSVANQYGQTIPGVSVTFTSGAGGSFNGAASVTVIANSAGLATAPTLSATSSPGPFTVTASVSGITAVFSLNIAQQTNAASLTIASGNNQSITEGGSGTTPLTVLVTNQYNQALAGVAVTFTSGSGASFNGAASATAFSNANGLAAAPVLTANSSPGPLSVTASVGSLSTTFSLTISEQTTPATLTIAAGNYQSITAGAGAATPLVVSVANRYGQAVSGVSVTFTVNFGAAQQSGSFSGSSSVTVLSDASGLAAAPTLTADSSPGPFSVTASAGGANTTFWLNIGPLAPPSGYLDTPVNKTAGVVGAVSVTGWALSPIGVQKVWIWRDPLPGEGPNPIFVVNATIVHGSRPDVAGLFPGYPCNDCGWGAQILTNELPDSAGAGGLGNGSYTLHALVTDNSGQTTAIGSTVFSAANAGSVLPFGTIDTPAQGETVSGAAYVNFGWALTPLPNLIPLDGSTITVFIDNVPVGHPVYNNYRVDIATIFPGLQNSAGAVGYFYIDTTKLTNGLHTIAWSVADNAGNAQGIGSRYFTVQN
jgi:acetyl esterase/lipase